MIKNLKYRSVAWFVLAYASCFPVYGQSIDAKEIVRKASEACKSLVYVEYISSSEQPGISVEAHVIQQRADVANVGLGNARMIARGERLLGKEAQSFEFSYDGDDFKFYEPGKGDIKTLDEPEPATVGRTLGLFYYNLVKRYLTSEVGLDFLLERADEIEYQGEVKLKTGLAHQLDITQTMTHPVSKDKISSTSSWFFSSDSYLPVKSITGSIESYIEYLSTSVPEEAVSFDINVNGDFDERMILGNEPNIEGLLPVGDQLPDFKLADVDGQVKTLEDVAGPVTIIDFWGTWCGPCLMAMPKIQALYDKYKDQGLKVVGISVSDKPGKAEKFIQKKGYDYEFLVQGDPYARELRLNTFPTVYIVDEKGTILHAEKGNRKEAIATYEEIIQEHLKPASHDR